MAWLTATYLIESDAGRIEERAEALAIEQSVECPLEAVRDPRIRDEIVARVAAIEPAGEGRYRVDVADRGRRRPAVRRRSSST